MQGQQITFKILSTRSKSFSTSAMPTRFQTAITLTLTSSMNTASSQAEQYWKQKIPYQGSMTARKKSTKGIFASGNSTRATSLIGKQILAKVAQAGILKILQ